MANDQVRKISKEEYAELLEKTKGEIIEKINSFNAALRGETDENPNELSSQLEDLEDSYKKAAKEAMYVELRELGKDGFKLGVLRNSFSTCGHSVVRDPFDKKTVLSYKFRDDIEVLINFRELSKKIPEVGEKWITDYAEPLAKEICVLMESRHISNKKSEDYKKAVEDIRMRFRMTDPSKNLGKISGTISINQITDVLQKIFNEVYFEDNGSGLNKYKPRKEHAHILIDTYASYKPRMKFSLASMNTNLFVDEIIRIIVASAVVGSEIHMTYQQLSEKKLLARQREISAKLLEKKIVTKTAA